MPPEPSHQGPVFYYSGCAHTKHLLQQRNNRLTRRPIFKGSPQLTTKPHITLGVCQNTYPTTSSTSSGKVLDQSSTGMHVWVQITNYEV